MNASIENFDSRDRSSNQSMKLAASTQLVRCAYDLQPLQNAEDTSTTPNDTSSLNSTGRENNLDTLNFDFDRNENFALFGDLRESNLTSINNSNEQCARETGRTVEQWINDEGVIPLHLPYPTGLGISVSDWYRNASSAAEAELINDNTSVTGLTAVNQVPAAATAPLPVLLAPSPEAALSCHSPADVQAPPSDAAVRNGDRLVPINRAADVRGSRPERNVTREINPAIDNPQAVQQRYEASLDALVASGQLTAAERDHMRQSFNQSMAAMANLYTPEEMQRIGRSMNTIMDDPVRGPGLSPLQRANAVVDLAAQAEDSRDGFTSSNAFAQGGHNTCAGTSHNRLLAQRNFVEYADRIASAASQGGAWVGGQNGTNPMWVELNAVNYAGDAESNRPWNRQNMLQGGQRGTATLLGNAIEGSAQAMIATERDRARGIIGANERYEYVTANAHALGAPVGQNATGEGTFITNTETGQRRFQNGGPPATLDVVGLRNHQDGLGGLFVHENFRGQIGNVPGINYFRDGADLRSQLQRMPSGAEYQIITNGAIVAGRQGHGLHAQTISLDRGSDQVLVGNNWDSRHNRVAVNNDQINLYSNPSEWGSYQNRPRPDGRPDVRPPGRDPHSPDGGPRPRNWLDERFNDDWRRNQPRDAHRPENQESDEERQQRNPVDGNSRSQVQLATWMSQRMAAEARGQDALNSFLASNPRPSFS